MTNFLLKPHFCDELLLAFSLNRIIRDVMNNVTKQCDEFNSPRCFITFGNCCEVVAALKPLLLVVVVYHVSSYLSSPFLFLCSSR